MKYKSIIICLVIIILNSSLIYSATSKRPTKPMRTTVKKTTVESTKVAQCYQSFKGYYEDKFYNVSSPSACLTNCFSYKESIGIETVESGTCNDETTCVGGIFVVKYNYTFIYDCCNSNLCNSQEYIKKKLNYKCEFRKEVPKTKKLIFPVRKLNATSVKRCYICENCKSASSAQIMDCSQRNSTVKNFACLHSYYGSGQNQYWSGDCINAEDMVNVVYEKMNTKVVSCQADACNSPDNMKKLKSATLCQDGFYE